MYGGKPAFECREVSRAQFYTVSELCPRPIQFRLFRRRYNENNNNNNNNNKILCYNNRRRVNAACEGTYLALTPTLDVAASSTCKYTVTSSLHVLCVWQQSIALAVRSFYCHLL